MPLTPIDIQQKTFGPELRGYNMDEVDDFLDEVVSTLKDYDQRIRDAQDRIRALEAEVTTRGEDETAISRALVAAQKQADAVLEEAHQEAERIRADAFDEADHLRTERDAERMTLTQEIARMRATVADLKRRVVELSSSAAADLDAMDAAIAQASEAVAESAIPEERPEESPAEREEEPTEVGHHLGAWADSSSDRGAHEPGWGEDAGVADEPRAGWEGEGDATTGEAPEGYGEPGEVHGESTGDEDLGELADEMADEATGSPDSGEESPPQPSRRPWERGSV